MSDTYFSLLGDGAQYKCLSYSYSYSRRCVWLFKTNL